MVIGVIAKHMREAMLEGYEVYYEEVKKLKADRILELPWDCLDENEFLYLYKNNGVVCAAIRLSEDPLEDWIWIDEFEVVRDFRHNGLGRQIICDFLNDSDQIIKLQAKNRTVAEFWQKCGFEYENLSWDEILMRYIPKSYNKIQ